MTEVKTKTFDKSLVCSIEVLSPYNTIPGKHIIMSSIIAGVVYGQPLFDHAERKGVGYIANIVYNDVSQECDNCLRTASTYIFYRVLIMLVHSD